MHLLLVVLVALAIAAVIVWLVRAIH